MIIKNGYREKGMKIKIQLSDPNPASPANAEASQLYERDRGYDILYFHLKGLEIIFASCLCPYLCLCPIFPSSLPLFFFLSYSFSFSPTFLSHSCFPILVCVFELFYTFLSYLVISPLLFYSLVMSFPIISSPLFFSLLFSCNLYHSSLLSSSYLYFPLLSYINLFPSMIFHYSPANLVSMLGLIISFSKLSQTSLCLISILVSTTSEYVPSLKKAGWMTHPQLMMTYVVFRI